MKNRKCINMPDHLWPPSNALEKEVVVFRLTKVAGVVRPEDFLSSYDVDKERGKLKEDRLDTDTYYAVSVFEDESDARSLIRKFSKIFKDISIGTTKPTDGCIRNDPSLTAKSHDNWWLYENAEPDKYFKILKEGLDA